MNARINALRRWVARFAEYILFVLTIGFAGATFLFNLFAPTDRPIVIVVLMATGLAAAGIVITVKQEMERLTEIKGRIDQFPESTRHEVDEGFDRAVQRINKVIFEPTVAQNFVTARRLVEDAPPKTMMRMSGLSPKPPVTREEQEWDDARVERIRVGDCRTQRVIAIYEKRDWESLQRHLETLLAPDRRYPPNYELRLLWDQCQPPDQKYYFDLLIIGKEHGLLAIPRTTVPEHQYGAFHFMDPEMIEALRALFDNIWHDAEPHKLVKDGSMNEALYQKLRKSLEKLSM